MANTNRITFNQMRWLIDMANGYDPMDRFSGQSEYGGANTILYSLLRRGLIGKDGLTEAAKEFIKKESGKRRWEGTIVGEYYLFKVLNK